MKKSAFVFTILPFFVALVVSCTNAPKTPEELVSFPLSAVRLTDSPFLHASKLNEAYVLAHDPDRLLAPFLMDAGLEPKAERYGNWENTGLDGHTGGHYLTSLALIIASSGNEEANKRLQYMIAELARCQEANGNGYVGGVPGGKAMWEDIAKGNIRAGNFSLNGKWVPWYNIHKLYAGLKDAYILAGNQQALEILIKLSDWTVELCSNLTDEQMQNMLVSEHGGMNEVFADVYDITGNEEYLELARRFSHHAILNPLLAKEDHLTGLHANTQIPKVVGFMRIAQVTNNVEWEDASDYFFETVVNNRSVSIGGNSTYEHFHPADDFTSMVESREGPETCNTYNMMKLARLLYLSKTDLKYMDFYERALYNHILGSQHPDHGGLVYFTSMRPQHYRVYSQPEVNFWCCVGSGIENHAKYGELIYAHDYDNLYVNLFIPSELNWKDKGLQIVQTTEFPEAETTKLTLNLEKSSRFSINIRYPNWVRIGQMQVKVNGKTVRGSANPGEYFSVHRNWTNGDVIEVHFPMHTYGEYLPDELPYMAVLHGPIVLAAATGQDGLDGLIADGSRMGHIAHGPLYARDDAPLLVIDDENWMEKVKPVEGDPLTFEISELVYPESSKGTKLIPFYRLHDSRYIVYWQTASSTEMEEMLQNLQIEEQAAMALEAITIDQVETGQQQPESDRNFQSENTEAGIHKNRHWRHATGWFSYDLKDPGNEAKTLRITYFGLDTGRTFDILINDRQLATVQLDGSRGDGFFEVDYHIPSDFIVSNKCTVKFKAHEGSIAGGIYHVRLLRE
jgi:uncharacterized protein